MTSAIFCALLHGVAQGSHSQEQIPDTIDSPSESRHSPVFASSRLLTEDAHGNVSIASLSATARVLVERGFERSGPGSALNCDRRRYPDPFERNRRPGSWRAVVESADVVALVSVQLAETGFLHGISGTIARVDVDRLMRGDFRPPTPWYVFVPVATIRTRDRCLHRHPLGFEREPRPGEQLSLFLRDIPSLEQVPIQYLHEEDFVILSKDGVVLSKRLELDHAAASQSSTRFVEWLEERVAARER